MSIASIIARTPQPVTANQLREELAKLGVTLGDILLVHSSLSSLGWVCGGAQTVLEALFAAVGETGTLVMPAQTCDNTDPAFWGNPPVPAAWVEQIREQMPPYDPSKTPSSGMGQIAELFRTYPGTLRSSHPQTSFCANGPLAKSVVASHPLTPQFGLDSPLGALYRMGKEGKPVKILLLGVGYHRCTALHLAEQLWGKGEKGPMGAALLKNGERKWVTFEDMEPVDGDFDRIGDAFEAAFPGGREAPWRRGPVGLADCRLCALDKLVNFGVSWMEEHRTPCHPPQETGKTLYVSDLDGTLLTPQARLSPYTASVLARLKDQGIPFTFATARSLTSTRRAIQNLPVSLPAVVYNGVFVCDLDTGTPLVSHSFSPEDIRLARELFRRHGLSPLVYSLIQGRERVSYLPHPDNKGMAGYLRSRHGDPRLRPVEREEDLWEGAPFYFSCIEDSRECLLSLYQEASQDPRFRCMLQQEVYDENCFWCELMPAQASKAQGVLRLKELLGCDRVVCFGDGLNDLPLFALSDESYAVQNAVEELKSVATGIIPSNQEDGVAHFLEEQVLSR